MKILKNFCFLLSLILLTFSSCSDDETDQNLIIEQTEIANGYLNSNEIISDQNIVITNQVEWQNLLDTMESVDSNILESFSDIDLDFENVQVLAVFDEIRPHTGYFVQISTVLENKNNIVASVIKNNSDAGYTTLTQPFQIVSIKRSNKNVVFE